MITGIIYVLGGFCFSTCVIASYPEVGKKELSLITAVWPVLATVALIKVIIYVIKK